jgi:hypothetical protein
VERGQKLYGNYEQELAKTTCNTLTHEEMFPFICNRNANLNSLEVAVPLQRAVEQWS